MGKITKRIISSVCAAALVLIAPAAAACNPQPAVEAADQWKITLDFNDGISRDGALFVDKTQSVELPSDPVREGYAFAGWQTEEGEDVSGTYTPSSDITLVAQWVGDTCTVTFDLNYPDSVPVIQELTYGGNVSDPPTPERDGYTFRYWSVSPDGAQVDFANYPVNGDYTFYAIWREADIEEYTVTFSAGAYEGSPAATSMVILEGERVNESDAPRRLTRAGYNLAGWTAEEPAGEDWTIDVYPADDLPELVDFPYVPTSNVTLHAVWTIGRYAAVFSVNYTDCPEANGIYKMEYYLSNQQVAEPEPPSRTNYVFDGWYTAARGGDKVDFSAGIELTANAMYYAHWKHEGV